MKLIIDIPEERYKEIVESDKPVMIDRSDVAKVLVNGTLLPKGHGRLIDADALPLNAIDDANYGSNYIRIAPTIIEADKGE